jgi:phosphohistidine phosphatase
LAEPSTIWIVRHGKSAVGGFGEHDYDRPLSRRGLKNGSRMLAWFARQSHPATWLWSSPAARATATAEFVANGFATQVIEEPSLYLASADMLLSCLQCTPADVRSVAIVAHNPGLTHLVNLLTSDSVTDNLATLGTARFTTDQAWSQLQFGSAQFVDLHTPKTV